MACPNIISQEALNFDTHQTFCFPEEVFVPATLKVSMSDPAAMPDLEHFTGAGVDHPEIGKAITK